jgi:HTH-type transcriptional regulator / antitoxin HigA
MIFDARKGSKEGDELELLSLLIDNYEKEKFPIDLPDPIEAIKFRMEQLGYKQKDLAEAIGLKSRVSEILNRKRKLTLDMIRKLHEVLGIPTDVLVQEY